MVANSNLTLWKSTYAKRYMVKQVNINIMMMIKKNILVLKIKTLNVKLAIFFFKKKLYVLVRHN